MTTRRNFILNATLGLSALAVAPSAFASVTSPKKTSLPVALGPERVNGLLYPRQALMREKARTAREMYLCWGQRSGKSHLASVIYQDRLNVLSTNYCSGDGIRHIFVVTPNTPSRNFIEIFAPYAASYPHPALQHIYDHDYGVATHFLSINQFMNRVVVTPSEKKHSGGYPLQVDSIFLDEVDWFEKHSLFEILQETSSMDPGFLFMSSSPSSRASAFLHDTRWGMTFPREGAVCDHATTFEVNPLYTRASLAEEEKHNPEAFARDFLAYK